MNEKSRPPPGAGFPERIQRVRCGKLLLSRVYDRDSSSFLEKSKPDVASGSLRLAFALAQLLLLLVWC